MYAYVRCERSTNGAFSCSRLPGSFAYKRRFKKQGERERKSMNNQSTLLFFLFFSGSPFYSQPVSQQSNCILLNIPLLFSFSCARLLSLSFVDMTIGTKSRKNIHKYIEHDGEMMKEDEDE